MFRFLQASIFLLVFTSISHAAKVVTCVQPDNKLPMSIGYQYVYYTLPSGTQAKCDAAKGVSTCQRTGKFSPAIASSRFEFCNVTPVTCVQPDNKLLMSVGYEYVYYTQPSGTQAQCDAAKRVSTCQNTGTFSPAIGTSRSEFCEVIASVVSTKEYLGTGPQQSLDPKCTPGKYNDFIDLPYAQLARRVEPQDCASINLATPIFSWTLPNDRKISVPMTLKIRRPLDNFTLSQTSNVPRLLAANTSLASGSYEWTVSYTNSSNVVVTSQARRFTIASGQPLVTLPSPTTFANIVSTKSHPRALPTGSTFATIVSKAKNGEYNLGYASFIKKADTLLNTAISPIPQDLNLNNFSGKVEYTTWLQELRKKTQLELSAIETLGYARQFTGNIAYETAGISRLLSLAAWPTSGATSEIGNDQANREIFLALGLGLDLFQGKLSSAQRLIVVNTLKNRLNQSLANIWGFDVYPYNSHLIVHTQYILETLMYAAGTPEFPEAKDLLATAWENFSTVLGTWGGSLSGGFANGGAYSWYDFTALVRVTAAIKLVAGVDLSLLPAVGKYGDGLIAFSAPGILLRGQFGDDVETNAHYGDYAYNSFRLYASITGRPEHEWYWRVDSRGPALASPFQPMHYLLLGYELPSAPAATPELPNSWLFEDAGMVAMHSNTVNPLRSSVFFRSSRFGSFNHSHADNNGFTFVSKGKELLISGGYYPYYFSPHHSLVGRATRFKNALTFNGGIGQGEPVANPSTPGAPIDSMDTSGKIINFANDGIWAVTTGDATLAYRGQNPSTEAFSPLLSNAIRTVAYNRQEGVVVIYDWATSSSGRSWELNFQSLFAPIKSGNIIEFQNGTSRACLNVYGPAGAFTTTSGFPVAPENGMPNQYQTRYKVATSSNQLVAVTVIREDCRTVPLTVSFSGTEATIMINQKPLVANGKTVQLP
jgi:hypothetical protein